MAEEIKEAGFHPADTNGDGKVTKEEQAMYLEFKRKELEDADAMRDAQRSMASVYFVSVAAIVAAFFGTQAMNTKKK